MIFLLSLWLLAAFYEGLLYWQIRPTTVARSSFWTLAIYSAALFDIGIGVGLLVANWKIGVVALVLTPYRLLNLARFYKQRLAINQLRTVSLRAHVWVATVQALSIAVLGTISMVHGGAMLRAVVAALQLTAALLLLQVSLRTWIHTRFIAPTTYAWDRDLPSLSVLVPARNETEELENCLRHLVASNYPKLEILVLDDCSSNRRTPEIIKQFAHDGVRFIQGEVPDEARWLAKNQAYAHLAQEASGELLLFAGVDVLFGSDSLRNLVQSMLSKHKEMVSVLPLRAVELRAQGSLLQPMRYYWELCLPRRVFKRPPVLSSCWLITATMLQKAGGFEAVARSVTPEAHFARQAVVADGYSFIRGDQQLAIYSSKLTSEQYATTVRMRYPQLHRRLELVMITTLFELAVMLGPLVGLVLALAHDAAAYIFIWSVASVCITATYYLVATETKLNNPVFAWLLMPVAFAVDIYMLHVSCLKYEFSTVEWKGRNVCIPVMQIEPRLPRLE